MNYCDSMNRKRLYILRHAKTDQFSKTGNDFNRELLPKGKKQVKELSRFFENYVFEKPFEIWVSSAKRTRQTFHGVDKALAISAAVASVGFSDDLYLAEGKELLTKLINHPSDNDLLIIGHNSGISDLVTYFTEQKIELRTGEFIQLVFDCSEWKQISWGTAVTEYRFRPEV